MTRAVCLVSAAVLLACGTPDPLQVSAPISLTEAMTAIESAYAAAGGGPTRISYGSSNGLAQQIVKGFPSALFISADERQMNVVEAAGRLVPGTRVKLVGNRLAIVARRETALTDARSLAGPAIRRVAIGDPDAVPAGVYARAYLEKLGLWSTLQPKLVPVLNVRFAISAVDSGGTDAAFGYENDAVRYAGRHIVVVLDGPDAPPVTYPAAVIRTGRRAEEMAARFLTFLCGEQAAAIFAQHHFIPLRCR